MGLSCRRKLLAGQSRVPDDDDRKAYDEQEDANDGLIHCVLVAEVVDEEGSAAGLEFGCTK